MNIEETLREIRTKCRQHMNGILSASMREKGLNYNMNFGLTINQIKNIASNYAPNPQLAEALWRENTRELKVLATMLYPVSDISSEIAYRLVTEIPNQEIREQITVNLMNKLPFIDVFVSRCLTDNNSDVRATGYWILGRLLIEGKLNDSNFLLEQQLPHVFTDVMGNVTLRNAALLSLKQIGRSSSQNASHILQNISTFQNSADDVQREIYDTLSFEYEFYQK